MKLSADAEKAFNEAVEAAYVMTDCIDEYASDSKEVTEAINDYGEKLRKYYQLTRKKETDFWTQKCQVFPSLEECRVYDC